MSNHLKTKYVELIKEHEGIIHKVIGLYVDNAEDRKDLFQEILLQSWKSYANFKGQSQFSTWLYKVSLNSALTFYKKETRQKELITHQNSSVDQVSDERENHELLYQIIKRLNEIDRMLITLYLDGYKNQEVSEITGIPVNNVNVKIHRIKIKLIADFKKEAHG